MMAEVKVLVVAQVVDEEAVAMPEEVVVMMPEEVVVMPEEAVVMPEEVVVGMPEEVVVMPEEAVVMPEEAVVMPEEVVVVPEEVGLPERLLPVASNSGPAGGGQRRRRIAGFVAAIAVGALGGLVARNRASKHKTTNPDGTCLHTCTLGAFIYRLPARSPSSSLVAFTDVQMCVMRAPMQIITASNKSFWVL